MELAEMRQQIVEMIVRAGSGIRAGRCRWRTF